METVTISCLVGPPVVAVNKLPKNKPLRDPKFASAQWTLLADAAPEHGQFVLVKMRGGEIEVGRWDSVQADWIRGPTRRWGQPIAWALIQTLGE